MSSEPSNFRIGDRTRRSLLRHRDGKPLQEFCLAYNPAMDSRKVTALLKGVIAATAVLCVIALIHPVAGAGLVLLGLLFVPVLLWLLSPVPHCAPPVPLEPRRLSQTSVLVFRFQRPPPALL